MKKLTLTLLTCLFILSPNVVLGETVKWDDLVLREDVWFKKFTNVPFTGKTTGRVQGTLRNGKRDGFWVSYHDNGQLQWEGDYKNGKKEGLWVSYYDNGQLRYKGNHKNGKSEGRWVRYWKNGQLWLEGADKNGKKEGRWVSYKEDGTVWEEFTGTFRNGKKISD